MCKEGDEEPKEKVPIQVIIPEGLPEPATPVEPPKECLITPKHEFLAPKGENPGKMSKFDDLALSDINEDTKAR